MRRLDDTRSAFDHSGSVSEVLGSLDVTLEIWSGTSSKFFRGRVVHLQGSPHPRESVPLDVEDGRWHTYKVRGNRVRVGGMRRRVGDPVVDVEAFGNSEVPVVEGHG